jgi:cell division ATPase FtsA
MYRGLPKKYRRKLLEHLRQRKRWIALLLYDDSIIAFVLRKETGRNRIGLTSVECDTAGGIKAGRIVNSRKAGEVMAHLLRSVAEEGRIKDKRVLIGLDTPPLRLTPKQWTDDSCLRTPCDETIYRRILHNIKRESTFASQHIIEIIPLKISMDERLVEDPYGITGQMKLDSVLVSLSYEDQQDFEKCLNGINYNCEGFFSGFHNLCSGFSEFTSENEQIMLADLKYNGTDVIMFQGNRPLALKCYRQGIDDILIKPLSSVFSIGENDTRSYLKKYYKHHEEKDAEVVGKYELPNYPMALRCWEIEEIVMGQLRSFVFMQGGISDLLTTLHSDLDVTPYKLIITGEGAIIPNIDALFEKGIHIKTETRNWGADGVRDNMPLTAYGMARTIAVDAGATIQLESSKGL